MHPHKKSPNIYPTTHLVFSLDEHGRWADGINGVLAQNGVKYRFNEVRTAGGPPPLCGSNCRRALKSTRQVHRSHARMHTHTYAYDTQHAPSSVPGGCQATYDGRAKSPCNRDQLIILLDEHSVMKPAFRRRLGRAMAGSLWFSHFSDFGGGKTARRREEPTWKLQHPCFTTSYSTTYHTTW